MNKIQQKKNQIRAEIAQCKKQYSEEELARRSDEVFSVVELTGIFQDAKKVFVYYSMVGEVSTIDFINKWKDEKEFYLPVVSNDRLVFKKYTSDADLKKSAFGVLEPIGDDFTNLRSVDLIIVPGVAFDRNKNRLGYGKGYYDRFLSDIKVPKMGICYDFQLIDTIPTSQNDIPMNYVISENDLIW